MKHSILGQTNKRRGDGKAMRKPHSRPFLAVMVAAVAAGMLALTPITRMSGQAAPGGTLILGETPPTAGEAQLTDSKTGNTYDFRIVASEDGLGVGHVTMRLLGPSLSFCSARGLPADVDFNPTVFGSDPFDTDFPGIAPLSAISCGTAYAMAVAIDGCVADIEYHGYVHSDYPNVTYMGMMTLDLVFRKGSGPGAGSLDVAVHTPRETIKLKGNVSGSVSMDTCP